MTAVATDLQFLVCGAASQCECFALAGAGCQRVRFPCTVAVFRVGDDWCCVDTGLAPRVFAAANSLSSSMYLKTIPMDTTPETSLQYQLHQRRIDPEAVRHVFLTHMHADHIAGCSDFPSATFHAGAASIELAGRRGCSATSHLLLPKLLPDDFADRARAVEQALEVPLSALAAPFTEGYDVLGSGAVLAVPLPGHTPGHTGFLINTAGGRRFFMIGDAAWSIQAVQELRMPSRLTAFIHRGGWAQYRETLAKLHVLHRRRPGSVFLVPSHDDGVATSLSRFETTLVARAHNDTAPDRERGLGEPDEEPVSRVLLVGAKRGLAAAVAAKLAARFTMDQGLTLILAGADEVTLAECQEACEATDAAVEAVAVDCTSAAAMSRLVEEEAVDVVVAVGAVDAASALHAVSRVRAAVKACCAQSVDVRSFVVINSALHCFGDGHCVDTPVGEDAPLPPPSWLADELSCTARRVERELQRAFALTMLPVTTLRVGRLVGHDDEALLEAALRLTRLGAAKAGSTTLGSWTHVANAAHAVVLLVTTACEESYGRAYNACDAGDVLVPATMHRLGSAVVQARKEKGKEGEEEEEEARLALWGWLVWAWPSVACALARLVGCKSVAELPLSDLLVCRAPLVLSRQALRTDLPYAPEVETGASIRSLLRRAGAATDDDGHGDLFAAKLTSPTAAGDVETDQEDVFARGSRSAKKVESGVEVTAAPLESSPRGGWLSSLVTVLAVLLLMVALAVAAFAADSPLPPALQHPFDVLMSAFAALV